MFFLNKTKCRRKEKRSFKKIAVYYKLNGISVPWKQVSALGVSENGACVVADYCLDQGDMIELEIPHKTSRRMEISKVTGQVVWTAPYKAEKFKHGIVFVKKALHYSKDNHWLKDLTSKCCYFFKNYTDDCLCHPVENLHQIRLAYRVVYSEYVKRKFCRPHESRMYYTGYSLIPFTRTFILRKDAQLLGTISLVPDSAAGLPMESAWPEEIQSLRRQGRRMAEVGMLALNSKHIKKSRYSLTDFRKQAYLFKLFKTLYNYALHANVNDLIIGCNPWNVELYEYLNFRVIGREKTFQGAPAVLMRLDIDPETFMRNATLLNDHSVFYFLRETVPAASFQQYFHWSSSTARKFLFDIKPVWETLPLRLKSYLGLCYPFLDCKPQFLP